MKDDQLLRLYKDVTGHEPSYFFLYTILGRNLSIFDRNFAHVSIYNTNPFAWEASFLREVYEELQKELPTIKKKVIAKAIRELKIRYALSLRIELEMEDWKERFWSKNDFLCRLTPIDRKLKNYFKTYIKDAFKHNIVEWHWWNNLDWGL